MYGVALIQPPADTFCVERIGAAGMASAARHASLADGARPRERRGHVRRSPRPSPARSSAATLLGAGVWASTVEFCALTAAPLVKKGCVHAPNACTDEPSSSIINRGF